MAVLWFCGLLWSLSPKKGFLGSFLIFNGNVFSQRFSSFFSFNLRRKGPSRRHCLPRRHKHLHIHTHTREILTDLPWEWIDRELIEKKKYMPVYRGGIRSIDSISQIQKEK